MQVERLEDTKDEAKESREGAMDWFDYPLLHLKAL